MHRKLLLLALAVAALATFSFVSFAGANPASPFTGTWWSVDPATGGVDKATFGVGGSVQVIDSVTIAKNDCKGALGFTHETGTVNGDGDVWTSNSNYKFRCPATTSVVFTYGVPLYFVFHEGPDGGYLTAPNWDNVPGVEWTRTRPSWL